MKPHFEELVKYHLKNVSLSYILKYLRNLSQFFPCWHLPNTPSSLVLPILKKNFVMKKKNLYVIHLHEDFLLLCVFQVNISSQMNAIIIQAFKKKLKPLDHFMEKKRGKKRHIIVRGVCRKSGGKNSSSEIFFTVFF